MKKFEEVYKTVEKELSEKRFNHSKGVMERCVVFAKIYGIDIEKARLIGIAHDIAKEVPKEDRIKIALENGIELDEFEKERTSLIHSKLGAKFCKDRFGFSDDMCSAIECHTTAKKNMSTLDKILYLSDYCEPGREFDVNSVFEIGKKNLDEGFLVALVGKIKYTLDKGEKIHPNSIEAYNSCVEILKNKI